VIDIFLKIKEIRNKSEATRIRILWMMVFVCMVFSVGVLIFTFTHRKNTGGDLFNIDLSKYPNYNSTVQKLENLEKDKNEALEKVQNELEKTEVEAMVAQYINENNSLKGIGPDEINISKEEKINDIWQIEYRQSYKDVPVEASIISFSVSIGDENVKIAKSIYFPGIDLDINPKLSQEGALEYIKNEIKKKNMEVKSSELVIYTLEKDNETAHYLSWKINIRNEDQFFDETYFVDASSGKILGYEDNQ